MSPRPLTPLEGLGFESAAAAHLEVWPSVARLLRRLIERAGESCRLVDLAAVVASRKPSARLSLNSVKVNVCWLREALSDVGLPYNIIHDFNGYHLTPDDAATIQAAIEETVQPAAISEAA